MEDTEAPRRKRKNMQIDQIDQLRMYMNKLNINEEFMVDCMSAVLNDNLVEFFHSIGKSKHHIKKFEPESESSSSEEDVLDYDDSHHFNRFNKQKYQ